MYRIRIPKPSFLLSVAVLGVVACGSTRRVYTNYDPAAATLASDFSTFDWLDHPGGTDARPSLSGLAEDVRRVTEAALVAKGYSRMDASPSFRMGWHYVEETTDVTTINMYYGYTWGRWFPGGGVAYGAGYRAEFLPGTLILDAVDAATGELVWRGFARLRELRDPVKRDEELTTVIGRMLVRFPRP